MSIQNISEDDIKTPKRKYVTELNDGKPINSKFEDPEYLSQKLQKTRKQYICILICALMFFAGVFIAFH